MEIALINHIQKPPRGATVSSPLPLAVAALVLGLVQTAQAQEPKPARLGVESFRDNAAVEMTLAWRFHPGDDASFAEPAFDDATWVPCDPIRLVPVKPGPAWAGRGWFRRHLVVDPRLHRTPLVFRIAAPGLAELFVDGQPVLRSGIAGVAGSTGGETSRGAWQALDLADRANHVLAVRYELEPERLQVSPAGFRLTIEVAGAEERRLAGDRRRMIAAIAFMAISGSLALLHLGLFWAYPRARENLFHALWMAAFAAIVLCDTLGRELTSEAARSIAGRLSIPSVLAGLLFVLLTYYAVRTDPFPKVWRGFATAAVALAALAFAMPGTVAAWTWYGYFAAVTVEVARVERSGRIVHREGHRILLWALIVQFAAVAYLVLANFGVVPAMLGANTYLIVLLPLAVGMSIFLARSFARTNLDLERRLVEVGLLSEQVLAQERTAHAQELRQKLLAAEHARTEAEVEAARALQLSMLPSSLPSVFGLDVAATMETASEVGGDYYDFRIDPDGSLVVAFGDATGHGVAAGIVVTAVKALFAGQSGDVPLAVLVAECNRVLRSMNLRPLHMCLALARITPRAITLCSAAMPPALLCRARTGEVEELGAGGLPLGSQLKAAWQERGAPLSPGDTLLFASDGLFELQDATGAAFGFERAAQLLREAVDLPAAAVAERLNAAAAAWRGDRDLGDDLTFVVIRVSE